MNPVMFFGVHLASFQYRREKDFSSVSFYCSKRCEQKMKRLWCHNAMVFYDPSWAIEKMATLGRDDKKCYFSMALERAIEKWQFRAKND